MSFERLLDNIAGWQDAYVAQHPEPASPKRQPGRLLVKSIQRVPAEGEMLAAIKRIRGDGSPSKAKLDEFVKSLEPAAEAGPDPVLDAQATAKRDSDAREAKAGSLNDILRRLDKAIVEHKVSAEDLVYEAAGGTAVFETSPIVRCLCDVHATTQHISTSSSNYEPCGRVLLGLDWGPGLL